MTLLIVFGMSLALTGVAEAQDYESVPQGSTVVLPSGDSLVVGEDSRLVSDAALVRTDSTLRSLRSRVRVAEQEAGDRAEQGDSLEAALTRCEQRYAAERAWREATERILEDQQGGFVETLENFGLVAGGFAVCRLTEPR